MLAQELTCVNILAVESTPCYSSTHTTENNCPVYLGDDCMLLPSYVALILFVLTECNYRSIFKKKECNYGYILLVLFLDGFCRFSSLHNFCRAGVLILPYAVGGYMC